MFTTSIRSELHEAIVKRGGKVPVNGGIAAALDVLNELPGGGVSSWNDLTDKPFYEDEDGTIHPIEGKYLPEGTPWVEEGKGSEIFPETTAFFEVGTVLGAPEVVLESKPSLVVGETYVVTWDGKEYRCVCQHLAGNSGGVYMDALVLGNTSVFGNPDTGEPFIIGDMSHPMSLGLAVSIEGSGDHTFKINEGTIAHKIDSRCLPGGGGVVYVNAELQEDTGDSLEVDMTFSEISALIDSGKQVVMKYAYLSSVPVMMPVTMYLPRTSIKFSCTISISSGQIDVFDVLMTPEAANIDHYQAEWQRVN